MFCLGVDTTSVISDACSVAVDEQAKYGGGANGQVDDDDELPLIGFSANGKCFFLSTIEINHIKSTCS